MLLAQANDIVLRNDADSVSPSRTAEEMRVALGFDSRMCGRG